MFQSAAISSWAKRKSDESARKLTEVVQTRNILSEKYNELKSSFDLKESENAHFSRKLKEVEEALFAWEVELKKVKSDAEYYEDKSTSIELFTTVKVHVEILKEYTEGKLSSWDPEATFSVWEKMRTLYSRSDEEEDWKKVELAGTSRGVSSEAGKRASGSGAVEEGVIVEEIAE